MEAIIKGEAIEGPRWGGGVLLVACPDHAGREPRYLGLPVVEAGKESHGSLSRGQDESRPTSNRDLKSLASASQPSAPWTSWPPRSPRSHCFSRDLILDRGIHVIPRRRFWPSCVAIL